WADVAAEIALLPFLNIRTKTMWLRGRNPDTGEYLVYMPADRYEFSLHFHRDGYKTIRDLFFEPVLQYSDKQTRIPAGIDFLPPPPSYLLLNLESGFEVRTGRNAFIVSVSVRN